MTGDEDAWPLVGAALVARATAITGALLELPDEHAVDAGTLVRSLYEHVVHLAWLGADPSAARIEEWRRLDLVERLKADKHCRDLGVPLLDDREDLKRQVDEMTGRDGLVLADLATAADKTWGTRFESLAPKTPLSLGGLYAVLYRHTSATAHPSYRSLHSVVTDISAVDKRVQLENPDPWSPFAIGAVVYGLGLLIAGQALGWSDHDQVVALFESVA